MKRNSLKVKRIVSLLVVVMMLFNMAFVTSAARSLDADLKWTADFVGGSWADVQGSAVFSEADFEPGSEVIRYFKISNTGELAFSYDFKFTAASDMGSLADVIDVYSLGDVTANTTIAEMNKIGTLKDVVNGNSIVSGKMLPSDLTGEGFEIGEKNIAVALKMQENASSEYMGLSLENGFYISLVTNECDFEYPLVDKFKVKFPEADFLYRVGNEGDVLLTSLFEAIDGADIGNVTATVTTLDESASASGTPKQNADWTKAAIDFNGTGVVEVTITDDDYAKPVSLKLEVIDAKNVTAYGEIDTYKNNILLNDIKMSSNSSVYLRPGSTIHGNGFTFDVTEGKHGDTINGYIGGNYVVCLDNAHLDNVKLVGAVYTTYGATAKSDYNFPNVLSKGNSSIKNSYISNCAAPVRVQNGVLEIKDTTLKGGNFANLDIREADKVILDNVTTINQVNSNDTATDGTVVVGLGVLVWYENVLSSTIEVKNGIRQYNNLSETEAKTYVKDSTVKSLINQMYGSSLSGVQYDDGEEKWVNTGILSATSAVGENNITGVSDFIGQSVSAYSVNGYLRTQKPTAESVTQTAPVWKSEKQSAIAPVTTFNHDKNKQEQSTESNVFCYFNSDLNKVLVSFDDGGNKQYSLDIFSAQKGGTELDYTVAVDGETYSGNTITFDQTKDYVVEYTYTDPYNYDIDSNGNIIKKNITYTKKLEISVNEVPKAAKNAEFKFYGYSSISKTPAVTITDVKTVTSNSGKTYIMPATTGTYVTSKTIDGITVNCPKVYVDFKNNSSDFNWLYPVFLGVDITDYKDGGAGEAEKIVTHNTQATKPANLSIITPDKPGWSSSSGQSGSEGKLSSGTYNGLYGWTSGALGSDQPANSIYAEFSYKDNKGTVYYYCIEFYREAHSCPSCFAEGTLITLADGSQKAIEDLTFEDEVIVWDFFKGEYTTSTPSLLIYDGTKDWNIITLNFSDGTDVRTIYEHGFFDVEENDYIYINAENANEYIGHKFLKTNGKKEDTIELVSYEITNEYTGCYTILTSQYNNCIANGILTVTPPPVKHFYDYFEIGEGMKYINMEEDIEKYGLYTYDQFSDYISYDEFIAFNGAYLKILVEKGYFTFEDILEQIAFFGVGNSNTVPTVLSDEPIITSYQTMLLLTEDTQSDVIISSSNIIKTAKYGINSTVENNVITLTATGTAKTGYAKITVDGESFYTVQIPQGESISIALKNAENAKDLTVTAENFWGVSANYEVPQEGLLANDSEIDFGTLTLTVSGASAILSNTTKYPVTGDIYLAVYEGKKLIAVKKQNITVDGKNEYTYSPEITVLENATVKAFVWDDGMKPIIK